MPQLQINQGPQDALLYDNSTSYFTNVGYVRTSNFQTEYKEVDPQNNAALGSSVSYVIPKAADLLGPVDLRVTLKASTAAVNADGSKAAKLVADGDERYFWQWVDELGFAMIEKITFAIGSVDIETISGEELQIKNALMTSDEMRLGFDHTMHTGKRAFLSGATAGASSPDETPGAGRVIQKDYTRLIAMSERAGDMQTAGKRELIIPLGLFFTKHVSQFFPLAAIAGCNDVRITIKFRPFNDLVQFSHEGENVDNAFVTSASSLFGGDPIDTAKLFCHYVHVTGPEAQTLMNKEHVRLLKMWQHQSQLIPGSTVNSHKIEMDLSFLHPVSTLLITLRREKDINSSTTGVEAAQKGFFFYHGDGTNPNYDRARRPNGNDSAVATATKTIKLKSIDLTLNGQSRHPGLDKGIDVQYLQHRLVPMLHSNSNAYQEQYFASSGAAEGSADYQKLSLQGSKSIFVYPFSLNPEGSNPSGAVNFSKVSHARLKLYLDDDNTDPLNGSDDIRVDVYAINYNWLQIKDGRALLSFA